MRTRLLPFGLAALLHSPFLQAQPAGPSAPEAAAVLTLDEAIGLAESRSYLLSAARKERDAADGTVLQAGLRRNPEFNALVEDTRRATRTSTATIGIPIELGGKRSARVEAAERTRDAAQGALATARSRLRALVTEAFFAVLVGQERLKLANDSTELATRGSRVASRRVAAGKAPPLDEARSRVDEINARLEAQVAGAELEQARERLAASWGDPVAGFSAVSGEIDAVPTRPAMSELALRIDEAPGLVASRLEIDRRRAVLGVERSKRYADVTLSAGVRRDNELGLTQAVVGVSIPLQIFDRNQGNVYEAARWVDKAGDDHEAARVATFNELRQAARQLALAATSAETLRTQVVPAAEEAYATATKGFEAGKFAFIDVLDAQRALLHARSRYLSTLSDAYQAAAAIDRVIGR